MVEEGKLEVPEGGLSDFVQEVDADGDGVNDLASASTFWTDLFLYWQQVDMVQRGSLRAFFSNLDAETTAESACYHQFKKARESFIKYNEGRLTWPIVEYEWWEQSLLFFDFGLEFFEFWEQCGVEMFLI